MKFAPSLMHLIWNLKQRFISFLGGKTVGARALVLQNNQVLLLKHTYGRGWYTVGGTVEGGESPMHCLIRELKEEVGIELQKNPTLIGVYYNNSHRRHDYVVLYLVKDFTMREVFCAEVAEKRWFPLEIKALPEDISPGTLRRVEEYLGLRAPSEYW